MANQKIVFMGSPDYAVPILTTLNEHYRIVGVVTQPDQPAGRGNKLQPPTIKTLAEKLHLPVLQPNKIKGEEFLQQLSEWAPDLIVVAAYGKILPSTILEFPKFGCINVHASLLPKWRGASPIQNAILNGDRISGVTIILMDEGVDTGVIFTQSEVKVEDTDTAGSLSEKLAKEGAQLLIKTLPDYFSNKIQPRQQNEKDASFTKLLKKEDGCLDFSKNADYLERQVRAYNPWPMCYLEWNGSRMRIIQAMDNRTHNLAHGQRGIIDKHPCVGTGSSDLKLLHVQPAGKRPMSGIEFINGARGWKS